MSWMIGILLCGCMMPLTNSYTWTALMQCDGHLADTAPSPLGDVDAFILLSYRSCLL